MNFATWIPATGFDLELCGRLCLVLAHSLWQFALLAALVTLVARIWKKSTSEQIYALYAATLFVGLATLPITFVLTRLPGESLAISEATTGPQQTLSPLPNAPPVQQLPMQQAAPPHVAGTALELPDVQTHRILTAETLLAWAPWLVGCYSAGVAVMLLRLLRGLWHNYRLSTQARPILSGPIVETLQSLARTWALRAAPTLALTERVIVPQVVGLWRPMILLPAAALAGLRPDELEMILAHELAHVRRYDLWVNLVQRLAEAALFFNPALWYLSRRIRLYREYCCDEATCGLARLDADASRLRYAEALLRVVELNRGAPHSQQVAALAATGSRPSELRRRVARLFGEPLREPVRISRAGLLTVVAGSAILLVAPLAWQTVASDEPTSGTMATITGRIELEDGTPATTKGWMYYSSKQANVNHVGTDAEYIDQFSSEVPPGKVWLRYFPDDFAPVAVGPFELKAGEKRDDVTIVLKPGFSQPVGIVGADNKPIAKARLAANPELGGETGGYRTVYFVDDRGACVIGHAADTAYEFVVNAPGHERLRSRVPRLSPDKPLVLTMTPSKPTTGIVRHADGSPAGGAKIYCAHETLDDGAGLSSVGHGYGELLAATDSTPSDSAGRFSLDQLTSGSQYLFVIEAKNGTRAAVTNLKAGQQDVEIVLPKRHDMLVRIKGDLSQLPQHEGKPRLSVRQRIEVVSPQNELIGKDVPIELTEENGAAMYYRGLAVDLRPDAGPQMVEVSLDYPKGPKKVAELKRDGLTLVEFELPKVEVEGTGDGATGSVAASPKVEVVAIGTHDEEPQQWWDAEGKLLESVPFTWEKEPGRVSTPDKLWRRVVIRINAPIANSPTDRSWEIVGARGSTGGTISFGEAFESGTYLTRYFSLADGSDSFGVRFGLAVGEWKTIVKASGMGAHGFGGKSVVFSEPITTDEGINVVVSHNVIDQAYRIVAFDKRGNTYESVRGGGTSVGQISQSRAAFPRLALEELDHFEFQTREYEWTEINDLPVEPGRKVAAQSEQVEKTPSRAQAKSVDSAKITALKELVETNEAMYQRVETLHKLGVEGGEEANKWRAYYSLCLARADLAKAQKKFEEAVEHYQEAVDAAEEVVTAMQALHEAGRATLGEVLEANAQRSRAKVALSEAQEGLDADARTSVGETAKAQEGTADGTHEMIIRVVDPDGQPLDGVNVFRNHAYFEVDGERSRFENDTYFTDEAGEVSIPLSGRTRILRIWAKKPDFVPQFANWEKDYHPDGDQIPATFEFRLKLGTRVSGVVTNVAGIPIQGVRVEVEDAVAQYFSIDRGKMKPVLRPVRDSHLAYGDAGVVTDAEGRWSLDNVPTDEELVLSEEDEQNAHATPLRLRFSHPDYETIGGIEDWQTVWNPPLEQLRDGTARTVMKWVDKGDHGRVNAVRLEQGEQYRNADFSGRHFKKQELMVWSDNMLAGAKLADSTWEDMLIPGVARLLYEADLSSAKLINVQLSGQSAGMQKTNFSRAVLESASLSGGVAGLQEANFDQATITNSDLIGGVSALQAASFRGAKLHSSKLEGAAGAFQMAHFDDARLVKTTIKCDGPMAFQGVTLNNTELIECDLSSIDAEALTSCKFNEATPPRYDAKTKLPQSFDPQEHGWKLIGDGEKSSSAEPKAKKNDAATSTLEVRPLLENLEEAPSAYLTLWREASSDEPAKPTGQTWTDAESGIVWIRERSAHPNDGRHGKDARQFQFTDLPAGRYCVTAAMYQPDETVPDPTPFGISKAVVLGIEDGPLTEMLDVVMAGDRSLIVQVLDEQIGKPIEGMAVRLFNSQGAPIAHGHGSGNFFERTSEAGEVRFRNLPEDEYRVDILGKYAEVNEFVEYKPLVDSLRIQLKDPQPQTLTYNAPPHRLTDDEIAKRFPFSVYGRVTDEEGRPLADVEVRAATGHGTLLGGGSVQTDEQGKYKLYFGPGIGMMRGKDAPLGVGIQAALFSARKAGWYEVSLNTVGDYLMSDLDPTRQKAELAEQVKAWGDKSVDSVVFANQPREMNFVLIPAATLRGKLIAEPGRELEGESLYLTGDELPPGCSVLAQFKTGEDGEFEFADVPVGRRWSFSMRVGGSWQEVETPPFVLKSPGVHGCEVVLEAQRDKANAVAVKLSYRAVNGIDFNR